MPTSVEEPRPLVIAEFMLTNALEVRWRASVTSQGETTSRVSSQCTPLFAAVFGRSCDRVRCFVVSFGC